ncbi:ParB N-terminal domain-containing protein [Aurantimonas sp. C2-6-R+9]|uniref:ParB/RepB/Spo0J family partition protein n=1 Tax=unclassified Aurantimonas TaxID=2638230 RepID=UPI002E19CCD7|nr:MULTISPECIES: ParB N-terminal domain-containing protein [unclassified Aurantimonas]MEC5293325.1 ParB N-terminal domain-containing protein [Aurantimonas sp. C2-3-R2]MEC5383289.1 ParB N-terminal domain-containing protein [Aurantimonas sp. C2-6-R+9]MEC5414256.1 ParB N-terminal domain-containing protein [Aurantimonas sp. C2-4-R8]
MSAPRTSAPSDQVKRVPIDKIRIGERQRSFDPAWAAAIASTLPMMGLKTAIEVSAEGDGFRLIAGRHRLEGAKLAGWTDIPARIVILDERDLDASAAFHEAIENLMRRELVALDRMAHLAAAKEAHDALYPQAARRGPKTKVDEANWETFSQLSFSKEIAEKTGFSNRLVNILVSAYRNFDKRIALRLEGSPLADKQSELIALSKLHAATQKTVLDYLLSTPPQAANVADALAIIQEEERPDAATRRITRYAETLKTLPIAERDRIFDAAEEAVRDYAERRGWL